MQAATSAARHIALLPDKKVFTEQKIKSLPPWFSASVQPQHPGAQFIVLKMNGPVATSLSPLL